MRYMDKAVNSNRGKGVKRAASPARASVLDRCRALAEPIAAELGLELFDVHLLREGGRLILRFVIDCETGITHQHCEQFSKKIDPLLDAADPIEKSYFLEVSSPGAERPLRHEADFRRFTGKYACLVVHSETAEAAKPAEEKRAAKARPSVRRSPRSTVIEGQIVETGNDSVTIKVGEQQTRRIELSSVISAHLLLDQNGGERRRR